MNIAFDCRCGATTCRGRVGKGQVVPIVPQTEALYRKAMARVGEVEQALAPLLSTGDGVGFDLLRPALARTRRRARRQGAA